MNSPGILLSGDNIGKVLPGMTIVTEDIDGSLHYYTAKDLRELGPSSYGRLVTQSRVVSDCSYTTNSNRQGELWLYVIDSDSNEDALLVDGFVSLFLKYSTLLSEGQKETINQLLTNFKVDES